MDQELAIEIMLAGHSVFLTGSAGAGKTYALNEFIREAKRLGKKVAVTASTGIAASHLNGNTIHSWSGIGVRDNLSRSFYDKMPKTRREKINKADILIVDEISMLHGDYLDMVDQVCRKIREAEETPFGGLQVVLSGDFFQLPPVVRRNNGDALIDEPIVTPFAYNSVSWQELDPVILYLETQFRQDDDEFLEILNKIRAGEITRDHAEKIAERYGAKLEGYDEITELHTHNRNVDSQNDRKLAELEGDSHFYEMTTTGKDYFVERLVSSCLALAKLELKEGALVMALKNSPEGRYVNGSIGVVVGFQPAVIVDGSPMLQTDYPIVKFRNGWESAIVPDTWEIRDGDTKVASLTQIPLKLAYAITVHKSQGMTLDAARMNLANVFEPGMGYVALSRVKSLQDISITGLTSKAFFVHPEVGEKDIEFRKRSAQASDKFDSLRANRKKRERKRDKKSTDSKSPQAWSDKLAKMRETYPNAYRPWAESDDAKLKKLWKDGVEIDDLSKKFERHPGSIQARLKKHFSEDLFY